MNNGDPLSSEGPVTSPVASSNVAISGAEKPIATLTDRQYVAADRQTKKPASSSGNAELIAATRWSWEAVTAALVLLAVFLWCYGTNLLQLVDAWETEPDYSHGYLVIPIAALFLWARRERRPAVQRVPDWLGLVLLGASGAIAYASHRLYLTPLSHWSMVLWIAAVVCLFGGRRLMVWALPAIAFLFFMIPLPFRMEHMLSGPLQRIATVISCWSLQLLGQPAVAEGNTIYLGATQLEIEQACSGLRMLVMIGALAFALGVLVSRSWLERVFLLFCIVPVALFANAVRVVVTGLAYQYVSDESSKALSHDLAGWIIVPVAAASLWLSLMYWRRLFVEEERPSLEPPRLSSSTVRNAHS